MKNYLYYIYWLVRTWPMRWGFPRYRIMSFEETVEQIKNGKSISRFGDGEFRLVIQERDIVFQKLSNDISVRLWEVLNSDHPNLLVAIPSAFKNTKNLTQSAKIHWINFLNLKGKLIAKSIADRNKTFGDALISRFYMDYRNKMNVAKKVKLLQEIWEDKDLLIVEGKYSRLGIGNDFFANAKSVARIICPSTDAFEKYEEILHAVKKLHDRRLIIIAVGPTATVLAHDLAIVELQALDLGHIDVEYSWYLHGATEKVRVRGKKSAEVSGQEDFCLEPEKEKEYSEQIICEVV